MLNHTGLDDSLGYYYTVDGRRGHTTHATRAAAAAAAADAHSCHNLANAPTDLHT